MLNPSTRATWKAEGDDQRGVDGGREQRLHARSHLRNYTTPQARTHHRGRNNGRRGRLRCLLGGLTGTFGVQQRRVVLSRGQRHRTVSGLIVCVGDGRYCSPRFDRVLVTRRKIDWLGWVPEGVVHACDSG